MDSANVATAAAGNRTGAVPVGSDRSAVLIPLDPRSLAHRHCIVRDDSIVRLGRVRQGTKRERSGERERRPIHIVADPERLPWLADPEPARIEGRDNSLLLRLVAGTVLLAMTSYYAGQISMRKGSQPSVTVELPPARNVRDRPGERTIIPARAPDRVAEQQYLAQVAAELERLNKTHGPTGGGQEQSPGSKSWAQPPPHR